MYIWWLNRNAKTGVRSNEDACFGLLQAYGREAGPVVARFDIAEGDLG